jgi:subtilase family serine protease
MALDLDMVSAVCPNCKILLVEANSSSILNLGVAVSTAARLGAAAISNSYGGGEFSSETSIEAQYYLHPGIAVTASSGDSGYGVEFPAASQYVTAVGGTSLVRDATTARGWSETVWSVAGSGCSAFIPKPTWQTDGGCTRRTVGDVSAVANPNTGVAVYETYRSTGGWQIFGGTSVASPIIAGTYALALTSNGLGVGSGAQLPYATASALNDVTSGSNGSCGGSYLCTGGPGYDGPSGLGTPSGTGAF